MRTREILCLMLLTAVGPACATIGLAAKDPYAPQAQWGAGDGDDTGPELAFGSRLEPENQPPPGGWGAAWGTASAPSPAFPSSAAPSFQAPFPAAPSMGLHTVMPATGGAPVFATPLGGNLYMPVTGGAPIFGTSLTP
ncbi:MAG TPA: hypothetical protein VMB50_12750 [Myxococcales bacterium]|nr:hypothetical protein [Myxococcales bacterium]